MSEPTTISEVVICTGTSPYKRKRPTVIHLYYKEKMVDSSAM